MRPLLARQPLAVLSDIDGTLAPIVSNPDRARVTARANNALHALADRGVRIGFVTGRSLDAARTMIDVPDAYYAANHGLTLFIDGEAQTAAEVAPFVELVRQAIAEIGGINVPGVLIEDKGPIVALHYRMAASEADAVAAIESAIAGSPAARGFTIHHGRKVIELRPPLPLNKGTAATSLLDRITPAAVICLGDDVTDIDMFRAVQASGIPSAVIAVANDEETGVMEAAEYFVRGVEGVERLLEQVLTAIP
ncbi:MAG: trehalose-phosphatase [Dehalococcoidia bacterium]